VRDSTASPQSKEHGGTFGSLPGRVGISQHALMSKRIVAAFLWFYAGWYAGSVLAFGFGVPELLGLVLGVASAWLMAGDPLGIIWTRSAEISSDLTTQLEPADRSVTGDATLAPRT